MEEFIRENGLGRSIEIIGYVKPSEVYSYYENANVFVLAPPIEALAQVLLEAMASGLPVIASPMGGIPAAVDEKVGMLVPPEPSSLVPRLEELLTDGELRKKLGRAGRERVLERYSLGSMVDATLRVYEDVLNEM